MPSASMLLWDRNTVTLAQCLTIELVTLQVLKEFKTIITCFECLGHTLLQSDWKCLVLLWQLPHQHYGMHDGAPDCEYEVTQWYKMIFL
jgi:hypothetical protein